VATSPSATEAFLRRAADLRSNDVSRALRAAGELRPDDCALAPLLIDLLAWDEAMPAGREALKRMGVKITGVLVDALLDTERDFVIRRRVPRVLVDLPSSRRLDGLFAARQASGPCRPESRTPLYATRSPAARRRCADCLSRAPH
jgi:hypothetical protein